MSLVSIPPQLHDWRFIKLRPKDKIPIEPNWPTSANYPYLAQELIKHIERGGNYGVIGDEEHMIVDGDTPEVQQVVENTLPATFTVKTPGHQGRHYYFVCRLEKPLRLWDKNGKNVGDVQGHGKQVVGPGCTHTNGGTYEIVDNRDPAQITEAQLRKALADFIRMDPTVDEALEAEREALGGAGATHGIKITDIHPLEGMRQQGDEYFGKHPVHGSDTGHNFWINPQRNVWACFRHSTGGGPLSLLAVKEGIIKCEEAKKGALRGEKFKQVLDLASKRGLAFRVKPWRVIHA